MRKTIVCVISVTMVAITLFFLYREVFHYDLATVRFERKTTKEDHIELKVKTESEIELSRGFGKGNELVEVGKELLIRTTKDKLPKGDLEDKTLNIKYGHILVGMDDIVLEDVEWIRIMD